MNQKAGRLRISGGIGADELYWQGLEAGKLLLPRCAGCSKWIWPAHFRCASCGAWEMVWTELEPEGRVFSWTRTWYAFDRTRERADDIPYVVVLAEIPKANGARVLGILNGGDRGLKIGRPVQGVILPPSPKSKGYPSITWQLA